MVRGDQATKADLRELELRLDARIETSAATVKSGILRWMFGAMAVQTSLIVALVGLVH